MPSAANGRDDEPGVEQALGDGHRVGAGGQPDEVALRLRDAPALRDERRAQPVAALGDHVDALEQLGLGVEATRAPAASAGR